MSIGIMMPAYRTAGGSLLTLTPLTVTSKTSTDSELKFTVTPPRAGLIIVMVGWRKGYNDGGENEPYGIYYQDNGAPYGAVHAVAVQNQNNNACIASIPTRTPNMAHALLIDDGAWYEDDVYAYLLEDHTNNLPYDSASAKGSGTTTQTIALNVPKNGFALAFLKKGNATAVSWTGGDELLDTGNNSCARYDAPSAVAGHDMTASWSSNTARAMVAASWR